MNIAPHLVISDVDLFSSESVQKHALGQVALTSDGRRVRYVKAGASNLVEGNLLQSPAEDTAFQEMAVAAAVAVGSKTITVTLGASATTANQFDGGILVISTTPGIGQMFKIASHSVTSGSGTATFVVEEPVRTALTTSSKASVMKNPYNGVIQHPTTSTGKAVGVAIYAIPANNFGWIGTGGLFAALCDATATTAAAQAICPSVTTAGCVTKQVSLAEPLGSAYTAVTISAKVLPIVLNLD